MDDNQGGSPEGATDASSNGLRPGDPVTSAWYELTEAWRPRGVLREPTAAEAEQIRQLVAIDDDPRVVAEWPEVSASCKRRVEKVADLRLDPHQDGGDRS